MQSKIRALASDTLVYGVSTVIGRFLTFLLTPLYTNFLTASEIGEVTAIYAAIAFVGIVYSLGLEPAFMRFWDKEDSAQSERVFSTAFIGVACFAFIFTMGVVLFASPIAASPILQLDEHGAHLVMLASAIPLFDALVLIPYARLRMQRRARAFAMMRLFSIVINVALNVVFVVSMDLHVYGVLLAGAITNAATFLAFIPGLRLRFHGLHRSLLWNMLRFGLPTVPASFSSIVVLMADRTVMLMLTSSALLGLYQTNFRLALPLMMFVTVFEYAFKPFYLNHRNDADVKQLLSKVLTLFTVVCGIVFLVTATSMPYVVRMPFIGGRFINPDYWVGLSIIPVVMFAYYLNGVFINLAAGLHITMRTGWLPVATGVAAALNVGAMLVLVPALGIMGAAWSKVIAYGGSVVILAFYTSRFYPVTYDVRSILITTALTAILYTVVNVTDEFSGSGIALRMVVVPIFVALLFGTGVLRKNVLTTLMRMVRR